MEIKLNKINPVWAIVEYANNRLRRFEKRADIEPITIEAKPETKKNGYQKS
jgi:hypothetical protein